MKEQSIPYFFFLFFFVKNFDVQMFLSSKSVFFFFLRIVDVKDLASNPRWHVVMPTRRSADLRRDIWPKIGFLCGFIWKKKKRQFHICIRRLRRKLVWFETSRKQYKREGGVRKGLKFCDIEERFPKVFLYIIYDDATDLRRYRTLSRVVSAKPELFESDHHEVLENVILLYCLVKIKITV